ncbi:MAG: tetratricopeptide repeat protein [Sedimentisphaerales bacterium]|nr:tetratricopeptide repeat protein [Sedimentisphaerales bacterium]
MKKSSGSKYRDILICMFLVAAVAVVYGRVVTFDFVRLDDPFYITENPQVNQGLSMPGVKWAFTQSHSANWHPLTWLSHMLDCDLFDLAPGGHHLVNVLFHAINSVLLYFLLKVMTGRVWPSVVVAALFALHPLHVESVAWVSERKDVLSTFFGFLALLAYAYYGRRGGFIRYLLVFLFLALGLMAKPMLVTFPLVFLLLDYWPLDRIKITSFKKEDSETDLVRNQDVALCRRSFAYLLIEKLPFLVLSVISSVITFLAQQKEGAVGSMETISLQIRLSNSIVSYVRYIGKMFWPEDLIVLYPSLENKTWQAWQVGGALLLLLGITAAVLWSRRRYAVVGWLWYLGTLVPVIGLVHVGSQSMADRYTYIPLTGLFIIIAWLSADVVAAWPARSRVLVKITSVVFALVIGACMVVTWIQVNYWRDSESLFRHTLDVEPDNPVICQLMGITLHRQGKIDEAITYYYKALEFYPQYDEPHSHLGAALAMQGKLDEAIRHCREALKYNPDNRGTYINLGIALARKGDSAEAVECFLKALSYNYDDPLIHNNLAIAYQSLGKPDEAVKHGRYAVQLNPGYARAHYNLANALVAKGLLDEAIQHYQEALTLDPGYTAAAANLNRVLEARRR